MHGISTDRFIARNKRNGAKRTLEVSGERLKRAMKMGVSGNCVLGNDIPDEDNAIAGVVREDTIRCVINSSVLY